MTDPTPSPSPSSRAPDRMPILFVGHGSPMNIVEDNPFSRGFKTLSQHVPTTPRAILVVSAHWFLDGTLVTHNVAPPTIHDFYGFPAPLYEITYPARGDQKLARHIQELITRHREQTPVALSEQWGLDHGAWSVLHHMYPDASIPVLQLSIDRRLATAEHLDIGRSLASLREQGVLILASGNLTHNLRHAIRYINDPHSTAPDWAVSFDRDITAALEQRDLDFISRHVTQSEAGRMSHPSLDHYLPLLYAAGASDAQDTLSSPIEGWVASLSMRTLLFT